MLIFRIFGVRKSKWFKTNEIPQDETVIGLARKGFNFYYQINKASVSGAKEWLFKNFTIHCALVAN